MISFQSATPTSPVLSATRHRRPQHHGEGRRREETAKKRPFSAGKCANFRVGFAGLCCGIPGPKQLRSAIHVPQETSWPLSVPLLQPFLAVTLSSMVSSWKPRLTSCQEKRASCLEKRTYPSQFSEEPCCSHSQQGHSHLWCQAGNRG